MVQIPVRISGTICLTSDDVALELCHINPSIDESDLNWLLDTDAVLHFSRTSIVLLSIEKQPPKIIHALDPFISGTVAFLVVHAGRLCLAHSPTWLCRDRVDLCAWT